MSQRQTIQVQRKPGFFWQGVLILAPVLVLTTLGIWALWKEQWLAWREAEVRAQELAESAAGLVWDELESTGSSPIWFDQSGRLLFPAPYEEIPAPHLLNDEELNGEQLRLWNAAHDRAGERDKADAAALYDKFLRTDPPPAFAAVAHFNRGLILEQSGQRPQSAQEFMRVTNTYSAELSEAGLPLGFLARARLERGAELARYAIEHPCAMSSQIIDRLSGDSSGEAASLRSSWAAQEQLRRLATAARLFFSTNYSVQGDRSSNSAGSIGISVKTPPVFWVSTHQQEPGTNQISETRWLFIRAMTTNGFALVTQSEQQAITTARATLQRLAKPLWLDFTVSVAGRGLITTNNLTETQYIQGGKGSGQYWKSGIANSDLPLLARGRRAEAGSEGVVVSAMLSSRDLLLFQQRQRAVWFGSLIAAAAIASIVGFVSAHRAFHTQQRLAELKSNFVSGVSHELRAPIASIRLMAEGLERGKISEPGRQQEYFRFIVQECRRLSSMIENVLDFARIEQGRKQYDFEPVNVALLVEQTVKLMEPYAAERGVKLACSFDEPERTGEHEYGAGDPSDFTANVDGQAIQQALVNLIDNAVKHSPSGESVVVRLRNSVVSAEPPSSNGAFRLCLSVQDRGPGIPAAEHEKIFERFYRLGSELRRETPGVGIGLSIVKHIVEAHRGFVRVESEPGKGSCFTIDLPATHSFRSPA